MKNFILILFFTIFSFSVKSQTVIDITTDTMYFFVFKNDTVRLEPTMVTPGMKVVINYNAIGAGLYITDSLEKCIKEIEDKGYKESQYSVSLLYYKNTKMYAYIRNNTFIAPRNKFTFSNC